ncbi:MAG: Uma2 family endonuclease [Cyanobacteria bacterium SID2]|nr:Uma2 family endonuclease [Cyanobacteria bacterium SID2]MBP0002153.1 Uma2 family endonuclease [Cyanobacteria bacterium SBC]
MIRTPIRLTFEEYLSYDDDTDRSSELVAGHLEIMPPASDLHEAIIAFLFVCFYR